MNLTHREINRKWAHIFQVSMCARPGRAVCFFCMACAVYHTQKTQHTKKDGGACRMKEKNLEEQSEQKQEARKKTNPRQKRTADTAFRTNILTDRGLWDDFKLLAHLRQTTPNALLEEMIRRNVEANRDLLEQFKELSKQANEG